MITLSSLDLQKTTPQELGELLIEAKKAYYTTARPIMDDHTYDTLEEILRQKNPYHRVFQKVGNPNFDTGFLKRKHSIPMGSQNKVTTKDELIHYFELKKIPQDTDFIVEPKCDGISLEIEYKEGRVVDAITRGDGEIGDVITQNVVKMQNFQEKLKDNFSGSIRCEIVVTHKDFKKLNQITDESYSNPRNAASGLSQRLDSKYAEFCSLFAVDLYPLQKQKTEEQKISLLKSLGLIPVDSFHCKNFEEIENIYQRFFKEDRNSYLFDIDGLVVKINSLELQHHLGSKGNHPKGQVAYKFPSRSDQTRILSINWQVGPMGTITPVAKVEPIELSGALITFASLANYDLIKEKNINIGDIIEISRRGDVIPHIEKVVNKVNQGHLSAPTHCPSCNTRLILEDKFLKCPNIKNCYQQIIGRFRLFCDTLETKGLSGKTIEKLYQANKIKLPGDFFKLTVDDIKDLENLGEKSAQNIVNQIQNKKHLTLKQIFAAAIIPNFSAKRIQQLITAGFDTPEKLLSLTTIQIEVLPGFQTTLAQKIEEGIKARKEWIVSILDQTSLKPTKTTQKFLNLTFCITGELSKPRKEIENLITENDGKITSSVTKNTSYLICNLSSSDSSKFKDAKNLGVKIITEQQLFKLIN